MTMRSQHHAVDPTLPLPAEKSTWIQEQMVKAGKLKAPLDLKTVTAPEYREKALQGHRALEPLARLTGELNG